MRVWPSWRTVCKTVRLGIVSAQKTYQKARIARVVCKRVGWEVESRRKPTKAHTMHPTPGTAHGRATTRPAVSGPKTASSRGYRLPAREKQRAGSLNPHLHQTSVAQYTPIRYTLTC